MSEPTWRNFETHIMQQGTSRNDYFHATAKCPRIKDPAKSTDRETAYVAYHEPEPCAVCHPELPAPEKLEQLVIVPSDRADAHFHRDEQCQSVQQMADPRRLLPSETDAEPCHYCVGPDGDRQTVPACPECDGTMIRQLVRSDGWTCRASGCGATFDEPVTRGQKGGNDGPATGLARQLLEADPDDVSAEHAGEPMTDGGQEMVLVSSSAGRRGNTTYHRDESCGYVQRMGEVIEKPLNVLGGHYDPCSRCAVEMVTDGGQDMTPLDRLFIEDSADRPDEVVVDELTTMDADEFVDRLESLANAAEAVSTMAADLERLRKTGLSDDDALHLIYGRNNGVTKSDIRSMFEAIDALVERRTKNDPTKRLLSDVSGLTLSETADLMTELDRLNHRYGGLDDGE